MSGTDINDLSDADFELLCEVLHENMEFTIENTKTCTGGGIEFIASNLAPYLEGKYIIRCMRHAEIVGEHVVRDLYDVVLSEKADKGAMITTGQFTDSAVTFAEEKDLAMFDGDGFKELMQCFL